ncbi:MAG: hypothetical protein N3E52_04540 [Candidatus Bathyarchaeota archaeon]|nr:hypothetical protein [Candidatus Bathyarchaeota archaeon]
MVELCKTHHLRDSRGYFVGVKGEFLGSEFEEKAKVIVCATGAESPLRTKALGVFSKITLIDSCIQYEMTKVNVAPHISIIGVRE